MTSDKFEYDIAFSFLAEDESLVNQLGDLLRDRFKIFIYSEQQKKLAGSDGEQTFNAVFGKEARVVAVLYRDGWGSTPFTRIEMTAIKNRAFDDGYDFTLFIPTKDGATTPAWLPKTKIYYSLSRFGLESAAAVLEHMVAERGGQAKVEDASGRAARLGRAFELKHARENFIHSTEGAQAAIKAAQEVHEHIARQIEVVAKEHPTLPALKIAEQSGSSILYGTKVVLVLTWRRMFMNSIADAKFEAEFYDGMPRIGNPYNFTEPSRIASRVFRFDLVAIDRAAFVSSHPAKRFYSPAELADELLRLYMDQVEKHPLY